MLGFDSVAIHDITDNFCLGGSGLQSYCCTTFLPGASLFTWYEMLVVGSVQNIHAYAVESSTSESCTASCCKDINFVKASHGASHDESLAEALCPETDFDPRDWVLNEDAEDTLLQSLQFGHH